MSDEIQERANKILHLHLPNADTIPKITTSYMQWEKLLDMQLQ